MIHKCHAKGCDKKVAPKFLMCPYHWRQVPLSLQRAVHKHYRPGQEIDKRPSIAYLEAAKQAIASVEGIRD